MTSIEDVFKEFLKTGDYSKLNEYYTNNLPETVLDDDGVKHIKELELPADYSYDPCPCNRIHMLDDDTWYHKPMELTVGDEMAIYRACKECRSYLTKSLRKNE